MANLTPLYTQAPQQPALQIESPKLAPGLHLLLRLKAGQKPVVFDYRKSIRELGALLIKYDDKVCNDNISVLLRDWGFQIAKLDLRHADKVKQTIAEQLDLLAKEILVNEINDTPLQEPVFLGEVMGEFAEFVGEKKMFEEYLKYLNRSTQTLKVHEFATAVLAWTKPIAAWAKEPVAERALIPSDSVQPLPPQAPAENNLIAEITAPQPNFNPLIFPNFSITLDPAIEAQMRLHHKIQMISKMLPGGFYMQGWKRRNVEQRNGAALNETQKAEAIAALKADLDRLLKQFEIHEQTMHTAIDDLKEFHNAEIDVHKENQKDLLKVQQQTYEKLVAVEEHSANLQTRLNHTEAHLRSAFAQINHLSNQDRGGGFCVVQ